MKQFYLLVSLFILATIQGQTTQDTLYVWKAGNLVFKQSIKPTDMDSITFKRPIKIIPSIPSITICEQIWATKNLDVTTYSDGTPIPQVTDPAAWAALTTGAWCYYNNDATNGTTYGKLYNWYAVAGIYDTASLSNPTLRKKLAPNGWHVPTNAEWTNLTTGLGGASVAGGMMKATGTTLWSTPNTAATNSSGFTGLPGGPRLKGGSFGGESFGNIGTVAYWWSSTEDSTSSAWCRWVWVAVSYVGIPSLEKTYGFSVRCLSDENGAAVKTATLMTTGITNINFLTAEATSGGTITSNGGATIRERGVVWSTSPNPTINLSTKTSDGSDTGSFSSSMKGLLASTTYFVRAYATNCAGTGYGSEVSFTTSAIITIGTQTWTTKNLDVTTYSDGTVIPEVTDPAAWAALTTGAWCYYNNDATNGTTYGKLYNWYAVAGIWNEASKTDITQRKKLAPTGWHVPSDDEWSTLKNYLYPDAGNKMRQYFYWPGSPDTNVTNTNSSGFSALPGGHRGNYYTNNFDYMGMFAYWWSSSDYHLGNPNTFSLLYSESYTRTNRNFPRRVGVSVRCLRD